MKNRLYSIFLISVCTLLIPACSIKWTEAIHHGHVTQIDSTETIDIEINNKLIIVPITIKGKQYRFLFDTGAPFSISTQLQKEHNFQIITQGNIVDSDHNKKQVKWVKVDSTSIGQTSFLDQTAFVGDFDANHVLKCMAIDGIIGSNLIRHCNWTLDQDRQTISLFNHNDLMSNEKAVIIPFSTDYQYNMFIDVHFGQAEVNNLLVDYGSNGSIALGNELFTELKNRNIIGSTYLEIGSKQSGIIGKAVDLEREISYSDSVKIDKLPLNNVTIRTGKTTSVGNDLLSRFKITIDWDHQNLYLTNSKNVVDKTSSIGFKLGYSPKEGIYIQSVLEKSNAYTKGVRPLMKVIKIDNLDFENGSDFCEYVDYVPDNIIYLKIVNAQGKEVDYAIEKTIYRSD